MTEPKQVLLPDKYACIPRVLIFPVDEDGRVLLLKGAEDKKIWPGLWNGLGGHVEKGESALQAARRELLEESGLRAGRLDYMGALQVDTGTRVGITVYVFRASQLSGDLMASSEGSLAWWLQEEALDLPMVEDLYTLMPLMLAKPAESPPFWATYQYDPANQLIVSIEPNFP